MYSSISYVRQCDRNQQAFLVASTIAVLITSIPSTTIYYLAPPIFLLWCVTHSKIIPLLRLVVIWSFILVINGVGLFAALLVESHISWTGFIFWFITYMPLLILCTANFQLAISEPFLHRIRLIVFAFAWVQIATAVIQISAMSVLGTAAGIEFGDAVDGTFGFFGAFGGAITISQVYFCFTMTCVAIFLSLWIRHFLIKVIVFGIVVVVSTAQSAHQAIFAILAVCSVIILLRGHGKQALTAFVFVISLVVALGYFYPNTAEVAENWLYNTLIDDRSPKLRVIESTMSENLNDARLLMLGAGAGQGSSRAAMFAAGELARNMPEQLITRSPYFERHLLEPLAYYEWIGGSSAISKPFFSILTVFLEHGAIVVAILGFLVVREFRRLRQKNCLHPFYCMFFWIFLFLCSLIENYLEFVQALMIPVILYIVARSEVPVENRPQLRPKREGVIQGRAKAAVGAAHQAHQLRSRLPRSNHA